VNSNISTERKTFEEFYKETKEQNIQEFKKIREFEQAIIERILRLGKRNRTLAQICLLILCLDSQAMFIPKEVIEEVRNSKSKLAFPPKIVQRCLSNFIENDCSLDKAKEYAEALHIILKLRYIKDARNNLLHDLEIIESYNTN
jgi:hypothetical protein